MSGNFNLTCLVAETHSQSQKSTCKDLDRNGQNRPITPKATYTPVSNRASSRSA
ncbi:acetyltransferase [Lacticaseibacillus zeae]|uniref:Acetyltransferase n=1 Tax=Lacticaseibacillus zeae TaxID=57037 RepID=A0A5R8LVY8_LACZE|nr:acetyltransferase [Lacticaseibacillus zeae]TLF43005.1 acetyltransferase [Lacticaseibacillus zeae]